MTSEQLLQKFKDCGALLEGHFILRSGLHSRQFFQCAHLLQYPVLASEISAALAEKLRQLKVEVDVIVSPAMGGILVGHDLGRHLEKKHIFAEKHEGRLVIRRFPVEPGMRYLVAEDVVTTGSAVRETCALVEAGGGKVEAVACLVDRSGEKKPEFGAPFLSLLEIRVETFSADQVPEDLKNIPASKPGSK
ncbi:MAG: orotate phosphoribosyltransferase [Blastochloris sp.]|nr:orotate phosphoribosyltransferase [Blastochloris sp.]